MNETTYVQGTFGNKTSPITRTVYTILSVWFFAVLIMALNETFVYGEGQRPVNILLAITMPVALFALSYSSMVSFREWVLSLDMRRLILLHSLRMVGMGFVFLFFQDRLPALFALPAGSGDAMAAVGALYIGIALYENAAKIPRGRILQWNTFGLVDFVVAVSMGVMTRTGEVLYIETQAGSDIMSQFPLALIPGFFVPFYIITHLIIYMQMKK